MNTVIIIIKVVMQKEVLRASHEQIDPIVLAQLQKLFNLLSQNKQLNYVLQTYEQLISSHPLLPNRVIAHINWSKAIALFMLARYQQSTICFIKGSQKMNLPEPGVVMFGQVLQKQEKYFDAVKLILDSLSFARSPHGNQIFKHLKKYIGSMTQHESHTLMLGKNLTDLTAYSRTKQLTQITSNQIGQMMIIMDNEQNPENVQLLSQILSKYNLNLPFLIKKMKQGSRRVKNKQVQNRYYYLLGQTHLKNYDYDKSYECFKKYLETGQTQFRGHAQYGLGVVENARKNFSQSLSYHEKALKHKKNFHKVLLGMSASYHELKDYDKQIQLLDCLIRINNEPRMKAKYLTNKGRTMMRINKQYLPVAIKCFEQALRLELNLQLPYWYYAKALMDLNRLQEALKVLNEGQKRFKSSISMKLSQGQILTRRNQHKDAIKCFMQVINTNMNSRDFSNIKAVKAAAWIRIGNIYTLGQQDGKLLKAEKAFHKAKQFAPTSYYANLNLALLFVNNDRGYAIHYAEESAEFLPMNQIEDADEYYRLGQLLFHLGKDTQALCFYEKAYKIGKKVAHQNILALSLLVCKRIFESLQYFQPSIQKKSIQIEAYRWLIQIYSSTNRKEDKNQQTLKVIQYDKELSASCHDEEQKYYPNKQIFDQIIEQNRERRKKQLNKEQLKMLFPIIMALIIIQKEGYLNLYAINEHLTLQKFLESIYDQQISLLKSWIKTQASFNCTNLQNLFDLALLLSLKQGNNLSNQIVDFIFQTIIQQQQPQTELLSCLKGTVQHWQQSCQRQGSFSYLKEQIKQLRKIKADLGRYSGNQLKEFIKNGLTEVKNIMIVPLSGIKTRIYSSLKQQQNEDQQFSRMVPPYQSEQDMYTDEGEQFQLKQSSAQIIYSLETWIPNKNISPHESSENSPSISNLEEINSKQNYSKSHQEQGQSEQISSSYAFSKTQKLQDSYLLSGMKEVQFYHFYLLICHLSKKRQQFKYIVRHQVDHQRKVINLTTKFVEKFRVKMDKGQDEFIPSQPQNRKPQTYCQLLWNKGFDEAKKWMVFLAEAIIQLQKYCIFHADLQMRNTIKVIVRSTSQNQFQYKLIDFNLAFKYNQTDKTDRTQGVVFEYLKKMIRLWLQAPKGHISDSGFIDYMFRRGIKGQHFRDPKEIKDDNNKSLEEKVKEVLVELQHYSYLYHRESLRQNVQYLLFDYSGYDISQAMKNSLKEVIDNISVKDADDSQNGYRNFINFISDIQL